MSFIQNMKIPTPKTVRFNWNNFDGGINNVDSPFEMQTNQSPELLNVYAPESGAIESRPGIFKYATGILPKPIKTIFEYSTSTFNYLLCSTDDELYRLTPLTETYTKIMNIINPIEGFQLNDKFYFIDGQKYYEYNGTKVYEIINPLGTEVEGDITYNEITNTVTYRPTALEVADAFFGANNINDIKKCRLFTLHSKNNRGFMSGNPDFPNIVYSTATNNPYYVPVNQYLPPITNDNNIVTALISFSDVMTFFKQNTIFALYGNNEEDYELKEATVTTGTESPKSICKVGNYLYYLGSDGYIYSLYDLRTDYRKLLTKNISEQINLSKEPINIYPEERGNAIAVYHRGWYILSIKDKMLATKLGRGWYLWDNIEPTTFHSFGEYLLLSNADRYLFHLTLDRFYITERFTAIAAQTEFVLQKGYINEINTDTNIFIDNVLYTGAVKFDNSTILIEDQSFIGGEIVDVKYFSLPSFNDNNTKYRSYIRSKDFDFGVSFKQKQVRKVYSVGHTYKFFKSEPNIRVYVDYFETGTPFVMENKISLFGYSVFGDLFISRNIVTSLPIVVNRRGKIIAFEFEVNEIDSPFRLFSLSGDVEVKNR